MDIPEATNDSLTPIKAARRAVDAIWQSGFRCSKAGIITQDLVPPPIPQRALFDKLDTNGRRGHGRHGRGEPALGRATVLPAATVGGPAKGHVHDEV